jgi:hypothetical protein
MSVGFIRVANNADQMQPTNTTRNILNIARNMIRHIVKATETKNGNMITEVGISAARFELRSCAITRKNGERKNGAEGEYTDGDITLQLKTQKGLCWWCGCRLDEYHIDHRIPLSKGGTHNPGNIVISCPHCNLTKNNKMPWEWIGRLL